MRRGALVLVLVAAAGCGGSPEPAPGPARGAAERLAEVEDARDADAPELAEAAASEDPALRARAALAMGRMLKARHVDRLLTLTADANAIVRRTAVWALGQFGFLASPVAREREMVERLRPRLEDAEETVRAAAAEAVGKLAGGDAPGLVAPRLRDASPRVREAAAWACMIWRRVVRSRKGKPGDLPGEALEGLLALAGDADPRVRAAAAYALPDARAAAVLARLLGDADADVRFFALRSIRAGEVRGALEAAAKLQEDPSLAVRLEAVTLLGGLDPDRVRAEAATDPSALVRRAAALAGRGAVLDALQQDASPFVRAAALRRRAQLEGAAARPHLVRAMASADARVRRGAAEAAGLLGPDGLGVLAVAQDDPEESVRAAAAGPLAAIEGPRALSMLRRALASASLSERGTAVDALAGRKSGDAPALAREAYERSGGREWIEVRESAVSVVAGAETPEAAEWLRRVAASDPETAVRRRAWSELVRRGVTGVAEPPSAGLTHTPHKGLRFAANPRVALETTRGRMVVECFAAEAPVHVANFVGLAREGFYDGLMWHRVEPNFVIQGGDPAGSGWGDAGWQVRAEINDRRYARGTVGAPRTPDFDTAGCQLFITHVPTPQLDAQYTVFGQVVEGLEVIDRIEPGDRILRAAVLE